ncbi:AMP-binding protein [Plantactinospora sp. DSM 117369]
MIKPIPLLLRDNARRYGDRTAYADDRRAVTWGELKRRTARLGAGLGIERGARVAFCLDSGVDLVEVLFAAVRATAVGVPLNPHCTEGELAALLADCAPAVLVIDERRLGQVARVTAGRRPPRLVVAGTGPLPAGARRPTSAASPGRTGGGRRRRRAARAVAHRRRTRPASR